MRIYTRTGDDGSTGLFGGARTTKADVRVNAYGMLDEANCAVGAARAVSLSLELDEVLGRVQEELFSLGAELACAPGSEAKLSAPRVSAVEIERLEHAIDRVEATLPPLRSFVLPGGGRGAAALHVARAVVRRAERTLVRASEELGLRQEVLAYVNRLSDLLFVFARRSNQLEQIDDVPWGARA